jgi:hypothetical protein
MTLHSLARSARHYGLFAVLAFGLAACGGGGGGVFGISGGGGGGQPRAAAEPAAETSFEIRDDKSGRNTKLSDLFTNSDDPNITVEVNKYIWQASLEVLSFLPIQSVDPFTGVIVTGYGTPPGGGRSYRATIYVQDPALDARSLKVALQSSGGGTVSAETSRAVEDAILSRARQIRIRDGKL